MGCSWSYGGAWDTRMISTYLAEQWTWPEHSHSWMPAWHKMVIGCAATSAAYGIQPWTSQRLRDQMSAGDTRQALTELAREMTVCKGGIDMLGSAARGELSAHVQASGIGPQAMQKRAAKAHNAGGQGDRVSAGKSRMPKTSAYGLDFAGSGCDGGSHS